ncbi:hypothetical protein Ae201684P_015165 [Aphanomyces euteiches]|nr:hypothetical protein Ae201684P_015165 [Aphanomyces euteiches]
MDELNALSLRVFEYLGSLPTVSNVDYKPSPGIQGHNVALWEQPKILPHDLVEFLTMSNGLSVKWYTMLKGKQHLVGHFSLNSLQQLKDMNAVFPDGTHLALALHSSITIGDVCLVFREDEQPEIWLHDTMSNWVFLASTFTDYYRMMIVHLGLIGWQNLYTSVGLDPLTKQWFYLFVPGRVRQLPLNSKAAETPKIAILPFL